MIDLKSNDTPPPVGQSHARLPLIAGPMIWYALAGLSIILSGYLFLFSAENENRHGVGLFIGLWAPMFGILGLRAEMMELREDITRRRRHG